MAAGDTGNQKSVTKETSPTAENGQGEKAGSDAHQRTTAALQADAAMSSKEKDQTVHSVSYPDHSTITMREDAAGKMISVTMRDGKTYFPDPKSFVGQCKAADGSTLDYFDIFPERGGTVHYEKNGVEYSLEPNGDVRINNPNRTKDLDFKIPQGATKEEENSFRISADGTCHKLVETGTIEGDVVDTLEQFRQTRKQLEKLPGFKHDAQTNDAITRASDLLRQLRENLVDSHYPETAEETLKKMALDFGKGTDTNKLLEQVAADLHAQDYAIGRQPSDYVGGAGVVRALRDNMEFCLPKEQAELARAAQIVEAHVARNPEKYPSLSKQNYAMKSNAQDFIAAQEDLRALAAKSGIGSEAYKILNRVADHLVPYSNYLADAERTIGAGDNSPGKVLPTLRLVDDLGARADHSLTREDGSAVQARATSGLDSRIESDSTPGSADRFADRFASRADNESDQGRDRSHGNEDAPGRGDAHVGAAVSAAMVATSFISLFARPGVNTTRPYYLPSQ